MADPFSKNNKSPENAKAINELCRVLLRSLPCRDRNATARCISFGFAMQAIDPSRRFRFGVFEVDLRSGGLTKNGLRRNLQEQPFQVLSMLLEKPGELVTREELRGRLWARTVVDFDHGINKAISKIRHALGDSAANPRFIETVARRGYRFLADVTAIEAPAGQTVSSIRSLAVLPLENLSGDSTQEYFADGMTDELIASLGQISALRVISRTSVMAYKRIRKPLPQIARELNVEAVIEGTVLRAGDRVRITAQLIEAQTDKHIWARSYEVDIRDAIALQHQVARNIAEQIRATLSRREQAVLEIPKTIDPKAYEAYLKGRYFWNKRTEDGLRTSIDYFGQAIEADPIYAAAYAGLADAYALLGDWQYGLLFPQDALPRARAAASKALDLDEGLGEAHSSLAFTLDLYYWDWAAAEREHKRAITLNPGYATAHHWYAWHLIVMGRTEEALAQLRWAGSLDPLSLIISAELADALCIAKLYDESIQQSRKTLAMDRNFANGHYQLGQALVQKHMPGEAISEFQTAIELAGDNAAFVSNLAYAYARSGRGDEATKLVKALEARQSATSSADANIALAHVGLGDHDAAMSSLNKAYLARFNPSILMRPAFDPLRQDVRFHELLRRIGLPSIS
ncbi:TolB amino-terminal domain-containing protein [Rhizobiales bacterium GAS188]|nr:TolB amino-terminal domain-containing protein [Rhizobiales bacterium GAS188]